MLGQFAIRIKSAAYVCCILASPKLKHYGVAEEGYNREEREHQFGLTEKNPSTRWYSFKYSDCKHTQKT